MISPTHLGSAEADPNRIAAQPAKAFFVDMITHDIELQDAILDLLDNCIDGAQRLGIKGGEKPYAGRYARIVFNEKEFTIEDNCGGIPFEIAKEYAFRMGRPSTVKNAKPGKIGVYGIGMKRAIFKMGRSCVVHSHTKERTFDVCIDPTWLTKDTDWDLHAVDTKPQMKEPGTRVTITGLLDGISESFAPTHWFAEDFPKKVQAAYSFLIARGFEVTVNGKRIEPELPTLLWQAPASKKGKKPKIRPYFFEAKIHGVDVFVSVGFRDADVHDEDSEDPNEKRYETEHAGWTVLCNDRVIVHCDRGIMTGWGYSDVPSYHNQFRAISGFVELRASNPKLLPMTTTKRGVDINSETYMAVLQRMAEGVKHFIGFTHDWKGMEVKQRAMFGACEAVEVPKLRAYAHRYAKMTATRGDNAGKKSTPDLPSQSREKTDRRISFVRQIRDIETVAEFLFDDSDTTPAVVGSKCFDIQLANARNGKH
jgi:hypothetical protein